MSPPLVMVRNGQLMLTFELTVGTRLVQRSLDALLKSAERSLERAALADSAVLTKVFTEIARAKFNVYRASLDSLGRRDVLPTSTVDILVAGTSKILSLL